MLSRTEIRHIIGLKKLEELEAAGFNAAERELLKRRAGELEKEKENLSESAIKAAGELAAAKKELEELREAASSNAENEELQQLRAAVDGIDTNANKAEIIAAVKAVKALRGEK